MHRKSMTEHSDMQEKWNVAHWLETSAAVLFSFHI